MPNSCQETQNRSILLFKLSIGYYLKCYVYTFKLPTNSKHCVCVAYMQNNGPLKSLVRWQVAYLCFFPTIWSYLDAYGSTRPEVDIISETLLSKSPIKLNPSQHTTGPTDAPSVHSYSRTDAESHVGDRTHTELRSCEILHHHWSKVNGGHSPENAREFAMECLGKKINWYSQLAT